MGNGWRQRRQQRRDRAQQRRALKRSKIPVYAKIRGTLVDRLEEKLHWQPVTGTSRRQITAARKVRALLYAKGNREIGSTTVAGELFAAWKVLKWQQPKPPPPPPQPTHHWPVRPEPEGIVWPDNPLYTNTTLAR